MAFPTNPVPPVTNTTACGGAFCGVGDAISSLDAVLPVNRKNFDGKNIKVTHN
jgi:hypothetical protein